jgi:hypothetical protein
MVSIICSNTIQTPPIHNNNTMKESTSSQIMVRPHLRKKIPTPIGASSLGIHISISIKTQDWGSNM